MEGQCNGNGLLHTARTRPPQKVQARAPEEDLGEEEPGEDIPYLQAAKGELQQPGSPEPYSQYDQETRTTSVFTSEGTWAFDPLETEGQGLAEHTLSFTPTSTEGANPRVALIQAALSFAEFEESFDYLSPNTVAKSRTNDATGFRIDTLPDSNNPIFAAPPEKSLSDTTGGDEDPFGIGSRDQPAWRRDHPMVSDAKLQGAQAVGQEFITAAYDLDAQRFMSSIGYGHTRVPGQTPELTSLSATNHGVGETFIGALEKWNSQKTALPKPEDEGYDPSQKGRRKKAPKGPQKNMQVTIPEPSTVFPVQERRDPDQDDPGGSLLGGEIPAQEGISSSTF